MPQLPRLDAPGCPAVRAIMGRGIGRRRIFLNAANLEDFVSRLETLPESEAIEVLAWALLRRHFHLFFNSKKPALAWGMRRLLTGYFVNFSPAKREHNRYSYPFSEPVQVHPWPGRRGELGGSGALCLVWCLGLFQQQPSCIRDVDSYGA
jgi:hypothetical protein